MSTRGSCGEWGSDLRTPSLSGRSSAYTWVPGASSAVPNVSYTEVCDPLTFRRVPYGAEGTPVYTTLERLSQPMVRLLSGDLTRWEAGPSPCGRTYPYLPKGIYGRIDEMFTIRGENVYPSAIDEVVTALAGYGGEHRVVISREEAMDELAVRLE